MKSKSVVLAVIGCVLMFLAGCGGSGGKSAGQGKKGFPPEVAGVWQADDSWWRIELSKDGKVVSAVALMTQSEVRPNKTTKVLMEDGNTSTLEAGNCPVEYNPQTRELTVTITLKAMHIVHFEDRIDGNSTDIFTGRVSENGRNWDADWMTFFDWGPRFPQDKNDPNDVFMGHLLFEKVIRQPEAAADSNTAKGGLTNAVDKMLHLLIPADSKAVRH